MTLVDPGPVFAALADPTRRSVLTRLAADGAASATALARDLPVTRQAVVQHLAVLDAAGLTRAHRHGREVRHEVRPEALTGAARWMTTIARQWDDRLPGDRQLPGERRRAGGAVGCQPCEHRPPRRVGERREHRSRVGESGHEKFVATASST